MVLAMVQVDTHQITWLRSKQGAKIDARIEIAHQELITRMTMDSVRCVNSQICCRKPMPTYYSKVSTSHVEMYTGML